MGDAGAGAPEEADARLVQLDAVRVPDISRPTHSRSSTYCVGVLP